MNGCYILRQPKYQPYDVLLNSAESEISVEIVNNVRNTIRN